MQKQYAVSLAIRDLVTSTGLTRGKFIALIGYRRINSALRHLDRWIRDGEGDLGFWARLVEQFPLWSERLTSAHEETREEFRRLRRALEEEREALQRANHRPCLIVTTNETRPSSIFIAALPGVPQKIIFLPERLKEMDLERTEPVIKRFMSRYLKKYNGYCPFWGTVVGFEYSKNPNDTFRYSIGGELTGYSEVLPGAMTSQLSAQVKGRAPTFLPL